MAHNRRVIKYYNMLESHISKRDSSKNGGKKERSASVLSGCALRKIPLCIHCTTCQMQQGMSVHSLFVWPTVLHNNYYKYVICPIKSTCLRDRVCNCLSLHFLKWRISVAFLCNVWILLDLVLGYSYAHIRTARSNRFANGGLQRFLGHHCNTCAEDLDSEGGFRPVGSTAAIHNCTTLTSEFHGSYTASPRINFYRLSPLFPALRASLASLMSFSSNTNVFTASILWYYRRILIQ